MRRLLIPCQIVLIVSCTLMIIWFNHRLDVIFVKADGLAFDVEFAKINADLDRIDARLGIPSEKTETKK